MHGSKVSLSSVLRVSIAIFVAILATIHAAITASITLYATIICMTDVATTNISHWNTVTSTFVSVFVTCFVITSFAIFADTVSSTLIAGIFPQTFIAIISIAITTGTANFARIYFAGIYTSVLSPSPPPNTSNQCSPDVMAEDSSSSVSYNKDLHDISYATTLSTTSKKTAILLTTMACDSSLCMYDDA
jgi:glucan phosphoethanolaminetransferase (alkaline phosphatase superfamily)